AGRDPDLSRSWQTVITLGGETGFASLLSEIISLRNRLNPILARMATEGGTLAALRRLFGFGEGVSEANLIASVLADPYFDAAHAEALAEAANAARKAAAAKFAADLAEAL